MRTNDKTIRKKLPWIATKKVPKPKLGWLGQIDKSTFNSVPVFFQVLLNESGIELRSTNILGAPYTMSNERRKPIGKKLGMENS